MKRFTIRLMTLKRRPPGPRIRGYELFGLALTTGLGVVLLTPLVFHTYAELPETEFESISGYLFR